MLEAIISIIGGLLLLSPLVKASSPGSRLLRQMQPFKIVVGIFALVIGIINILSLIGLTLIAAGLILALEAISQIPKLGRELKKLGRFLSNFQIVIGVLIFIMGLIKLLT